MPPKAGKQAAKGKGKRRADSEDDYECLSDDSAPKAKAKKPRRGKGKGGVSSAILLGRLSRSALEALVVQSIDDRSALSREDVEQLLDPTLVS